MRLAHRFCFELWYKLRLGQNSDQRCCIFAHFAQLGYERAMPLLQEMARNRSQRILADFHLKLELVGVCLLPILQRVLGLQLRLGCILVSIVSISEFVNSEEHKKN